MPDKKLTFTPETHTYRYDGSVVPSVTQVLNTIGTRPLVAGEYGHWTPLSGFDFSTNWKGSTAAKFGTAMHSVIGYRLQDIDEEHDDALNPWLKQWEEYMHHNIGMSLVCAERPMYCKYGYAMTPDALFTIGDARTEKEWLLHDWKTGEATTTLYWELQMAAYAQGIRENMGLSIWPTARVVQITDHNYAVHVIPPRVLESRFNTFLSAVNIYNTFCKRKDR